jgi:hypothetical protein
MLRGLDVHLGAIELLGDFTVENVNDPDISRETRYRDERIDRWFNIPDI